MRARVRRRAARARGRPRAIAGSRLALEQRGAAPSVTGASMPWRSNARPSSGTVASASAVCSTSSLDLLGRARRRPAARRRGGCGCARRWRWRSGRRSGQADEGLGAPAAARAPARGSRRTRARRPRRPRSRRAGRPRRPPARRRSWRTPASSTPVTSSVRLHVRPAGSSRSPSWRRRSASRRRARRRRRARPPRARAPARPGRRRREPCTRSPTYAAGACRAAATSPFESDEHRRAVADARADLADGGGQAGAGHGEHDEVHAGELDLGDAS